MIKLWDVKTGRATRTLSGHEHDIFKIAFYTDGRRLASAGKYLTVRIWNVEASGELVAIHDFRARPRSVVFSPDGKLPALGSDYLVDYLSTFVTTWTS